jgi:hypothetical protein
MRVDKIERQDNYELKKYAKLISRHNVIKLCPMSLMECHVYSESISIRSPSSGTGNVIKSRLMSRFQKKTLRLITNAPWYVPNAVLHTDLQLLTIRAEITRMRGMYKAKLEAHPNDLAKTLCIPHTLGRISKIKPLDLPQRF